MREKFDGWLNGLMVYEEGGPSSFKSSIYRPYDLLCLFNYCDKY